MTKCPKCGNDQPDGNAECAKCGIVFKKYRLRQKQANPEDIRPMPASFTHSGKNNLSSLLKELFLFVNPEVNMVHFAGRSILFVSVFILGMKFIFSSIDSNASGISFLHLINLPFHEAGHVFFRPFGQFTMMLGGSITQLLIPFICFLFFLLKTRDTFAASICIWWFGENFIDLAPYINDAGKLTMPLIGGVTGQDVEDFHDWEFILRKLNCLEYDRFLAVASNMFGIMLILCALSWGAILLFRQFRTIKKNFPG